jgi:hypothetical protein
VECDAQLLSGHINWPLHCGSPFLHGSASVRQTSAVSLATRGSDYTTDRSGRQLWTSIVERRPEFGRSTQDQLWPVAAVLMLGSVIDFNQAQELWRDPYLIEIPAMTVDEPSVPDDWAYRCEALVGRHHVPRREHPDHVRSPLTS